ncbi:hypothetical protein FPT15_01585 [Pseudomonas sp. RGB]|nr:hypothetical protein FPT15_01585 [Pseudomonas sp. RGB]
MSSLWRPPSRASPLPHLNAFQRWNSVKCGSGLAREEAGPVTTSLTAWVNTPANKAPHTHQTPAFLPRPCAA